MGNGVIKHTLTLAHNNDLHDYVQYQNGPKYFHFIRMIRTNIGVVRMFSRIP